MVIGKPTRGRRINRNKADPRMGTKGSAVATEQTVRNT